MVTDDCKVQGAEYLLHCRFCTPQLIIVSVTGIVLLCIQTYIQTNKE